MFCQEAEITGRFVRLKRGLSAERTFMSTLQQKNDGSAQAFSKKEALVYGWHATIDNIALLATAVVVSLVAIIALDLLGNAMNEGGGSFFAPMLVNIFAIIFGVLIELGFINVALRLARGDGATARSFTQPRRGFFSYLLASILFSLPIFFFFHLISIIFSLPVAPAVVLLTIPGVILWAIYGLYSYALVDESLGPIESLRRSAALTRGVRGQLVLFFLMVIGVNVLGFLALGVGLAVTLPATMIATARVYYVLHRRLEPVVVKDIEAPLAPEGDRG